MRNFYNTLTEAAIYNASICCRYISWDLKIRLENLNEGNNGYTWMKCCTQGCHKMTEAGILK